MEDTTNSPEMPNNGITPLGQHPATPGAPTVEQTIDQAAANKAAALTILDRVNLAIQTALIDLPAVPGDTAVAAARSHLTFLGTRLINETREIKGI